jgi:hypothetical protein
MNNSTMAPTSSSCFMPVFISFALLLLSTTLSPSVMLMYVCMYVCIYFIYVCNCNLDSMSRRNNPIYCLLISPCRNMEVGPSTPYHTVQYLLLSSLQLGKGERCRREIVRRPGYHSNLRPRQAANLRVPAACDANEKAGPTGELPCNPVNSGKDPRQTPCRQAQERWEQCRYLVR